VQKYSLALFELAQSFPLIIMYSGERTPGFDFEKEAIVVVRSEAPDSLEDSYSVPVPSLVLDPSSEVEIQVVIRECIFDRGCSASRLPDLTNVRGSIDSTELFFIAVRAR
jgi:hypothetical protein